MNLFFTLLLIIFLAFSGYHLTFRGLKLPIFARKLYLTGIEFLFLGLLLGPLFLNILDTETMNNLKPLYALLLGWIGLVIGFQFEIAKIRRFPFYFLLAAVLEGLLTSVIVFLGIYIIFPLFVNMPVPMNMAILLTLTAAAVCAAQTGMSLYKQEQGIQNKSTVSFLGYISSFDSLMALLVFGVAYFFKPPTMSLSGLAPGAGMRIILSIVLGLGLLFLYILFLSKRCHENELILIVIGMVVITSGTASVLNMSPLLINFFLGFCLSNLSREKERIFSLLIRIEKPVYLLLLVFLGGSWNLDSAWVFLPATGYCIIRFAGKFSSGFAIRYLNPQLKAHTQFLGFGLLDQGGLPIAILFDFLHRFPGNSTDLVVSIAIFSIIMNDLISPIFLKQLLKAGNKQLS